MHYLVLESVTAEGNTTYHTPNEKDVAKATKSASEMRQYLLPSRDHTLYAARMDDNRTPATWMGVNQFGSYWKAVFKTIEIPTEVAAIGANFFVGLINEIGEDKVVKAATLNAAEEDKNVCHSHDFCDANMVMDGAFKQSGKVMDPNDDEHLALWDAAWKQGQRLMHSLMQVTL